MRVPARKRFGQHFLNHPMWINRMVRAVHTPMQVCQHWFEIGPGRGALTQALVDHPLRTQPLGAIELDRDLIAPLRHRFGDRLRLYEGNVLTFDWDTLWRIQPNDWLLFGNLPYNIATPLLFQLLGHSRRFHTMVLMFQREVALRLLAAPGCKHYGRLSVTVQLQAHVQHHMDVPPSAFSPPPQVQSTVLTLTPRGDAPDRAHPAWSSLALVLQHAFCGRRKMLRNALCHVPVDWSVHPAHWPTSRPEALSPQDWWTLAGHLDPRAPC